MNIELQHRLGSELWLRYLKYNHFENISRMTEIAACIFIFRVLMFWVFLKEVFPEMNESGKS